jgi:hypothetical protein
MEKLRATRNIATFICESTRGKGFVRFIVEFENKKDVISLSTP